MGKEKAVANPIGIQGYKFRNQGPETTWFFEPQIELLSLEGINIIVLHRMILNENMLQSLWRSNSFECQPRAVQALSPTGYRLGCPRAPPPNEGLGWDPLHKM